MTKLSLIKKIWQHAKDTMQAIQHKLREGQFAGVRDLVHLALSIVSLAIVVGVGALILNEMDNTTDDNDTSNILDEGTSAMDDFAGFFTIIIVIGIAAVIFLLLSVVRRSGAAAGS